MCLRIKRERCTGVLPLGAALRGQEGLAWVQCRPPGKTGSDTCTIVRARACAGRSACSESNVALASTSVKMGTNQEGWVNRVKQTLVEAL